MDDTGLMSRFERLRDLSRDGDGFLDRNRALGDALRERRSFD